jgi:hypothetical protein
VKPLLGEITALVDADPALPAIYHGDVLRRYRAFVARRRRQPPSEEYREPTTAEWAEFEQHFTRRKVRSALTPPA